MKERILKMNLKCEDYNEQKKGQKWLDALYKVNLKLEKVIDKLPNLSDTDRRQAMAELGIIIRRAIRLEYQLSNEIKK